MLEPYLQVAETSAGQSYPSRQMTFRLDEFFFLFLFFFEETGMGEGVKGERGFTRHLWSADRSGAWEQKDIHSLEMRRYWL